MSVEDWQKVSPALKRMAAATDRPSQRACPACIHRHPKGERCNYPVGVSPCTCKCTA